MKIKIELYVIDTRIITAITWKTDEGCARGRRPPPKNRYRKYRFTVVARPDRLSGAITTL